MSNVVPFGRKPPPAKETHDPNDAHMTGRTRCMACGHEAVAVMPVGSKHVNGSECSKCHAMKCVMLDFVQYVDCHAWSCLQCSSWLFSAILAKDGTPCIACAGCGYLFNALDLFNRP